MFRPSRTTLLSLLPLMGCVDYFIQDQDVEVTPILTITETFEQTPLPQVDVLFVIDATGSMTEEQAALAEAGSTFLSTLSAQEISYQLGVITTDPSDEGLLYGEPWIITSSAEDPSAALATALAVGVDRAPPSAGLDNAALALNNVDNIGFRRPGAMLHVIFLSDDDDESGDVLGDDAVGGFLSLLDTQANWSGAPARASAVVGDSPDGCDGPNGTAQAGTRYAEVAEASGGKTISICSGDFSTVAADLGAGLIELQDTFSLQAAAELDSLVVTVDGQRQTTGWTYDDAPAVIFDPPPPAGALITISYILDSTLDTGAADQEGS